MVATSAAKEEAESLSGDASPGFGIRRPNREGRLKRRSVPTSSRVSVHEQVSDDYAIASLNFVRC